MYSRTCKTGQTYCYYHLYRSYNYSKSVWDADYYVNYREWGCTKDLQSCEDECLEKHNCSKNHTTCCDADLYQLNQNYSVANHLAYQRCYYGSASYPIVNVLLVLMVVLAVVLR